MKALLWVILALWVGNLLALQSYWLGTGLGVLTGVLFVRLIVRG